jgi:hypothetical protein
MLGRAEVSSTQNEDIIVPLSVIGAAQPNPSVFEHFVIGLPSA